jgi:DNA-directed RNA polymerase specialized sigma24 family protein
VPEEPAINLGSLNTAWLSRHCAEQTQRFLTAQEHDTRYCYELFRRAICERDQSAWAALYEQYRPMAQRWAERHPGLAKSGEEAQYIVNRAFEKMWLALPADRFERLPSLSSVLRYLQVCVHSAVVDVLRSGARQPRTVAEEALASRADPVTVESQTLHRAQQADLWRLVSEHIRNERERLVVEELFVAGLKPSQILARHPEEFGSVRDIYLIRQNVVDRLRRDDRLRAWFSG